MIQKFGGAVDSSSDLSLQEDLDTLGNWAVRNRMPFNVSKCKVLHLGKNNPKKTYKLTGKDIAETKEEKDLGIFVDNKFKPNLNCNKVFKSANSVIGLIRRSIINKSEEGMMILYKTLVRPKVDYCIQVWRPHTRKDIKILEKIHRRFTKMIAGYKRKTYTERLKKLGITSLEERHNRADMIQVYKILNDKNNVYPTHFLMKSNRAGRNNALKLFKKNASWI